MQNTVFETIEIMVILIISWSSAFLFNYFIIGEILKHWKQWDDLDINEKHSLNYTMSLGAFPAIIVLWILGTGVITNLNAEAIFSIPILVIWTIILLLVLVISGTLPVKKVSN